MGNPIGIDRKPAGWSGVGKQIENRNVVTEAISMFLIQNTREIPERS